MRHSTSKIFIKVCKTRRILCLIPYVTTWLSGDALMAINGDEKPSVYKKHLAVLLFIFFIHTSYENVTTTGMCTKPSEPRPKRDPKPMSARPRRDVAASETLAETFQRLAETFSVTYGETH